MCAASICQALSCDTTIFAIDPSTNACVPLSGCFLTDAQRLWQSCNQDPCQGLDEKSCISDTRCQPAYANPNIDTAPQGDPASGGGGTTDAVFCGGVTVADPPLQPGPNGQVSAPGVNNGDAPKYPPLSHSGCFPDTARTYSGCRTAPKIDPLKPCEQLSQADCATRRDCSTQPVSGSGGIPVPLPPSTGGAPEPVNGVALPAIGQCFTRFPLPATDCASADSATSCLLNPDCQPIGSRCYCPPSSSCACAGGGFLGCEHNDRLRRCSQTSDCNANERCDNDEACITPRTFDSSSAETNPVPGMSGCTGACVPTGCAGMGEDMCNAHPECDGGSYGIVCRPKPYCAGGMGPLLNGANDGTGDVSTPSGPTGSSCGCDSEFVACGPQTPVDDIHVERSLLVRDPEIIDDPAFRLDTVLGLLAPAGQVDAFTGSFLKLVGAPNTLANGASVNSRTGFAAFLSDMSPDTAGVTQRLAGVLHITALVNRIDLAKPGTCGEARITYALTRAYTDGNQRMTMIVELRVPDDGNGCRTVAQRWSELSLLDSADDRRTQLIALYNELLSPSTLGQIRTNEFLNNSGTEPWELREFHLNPTTGMLDPAPVAQTVDQSFAGSPDLLAWLEQNAADINAGNAVIPTQYLAAASTEDGGRLSLGSMPDIEKSLNAQACAGCHLTETNSPFVHIGERLGKNVGGSIGYEPVGRAVIDAFLEKQLTLRAQNLKALIGASSQAMLTAGLRTGLARVH